jgi:DNA-binding NarL/FixJ family response regulator
VLAMTWFHERFRISIFAALPKQHRKRFFCQRHTVRAGYSRPLITLFRLLSGERFGGIGCAARRTARNRKALHAGRNSATAFPIRLCSQPRDNDTMTKIRTLVADDHPLFREGVGMLLAAEEDIEVVGLAHDGIEAIALAEKLQPDVIVLDDEMPRCNGLEATHHLLSARPSVRVIILSGAPSDEAFLAAIEAGARGYLGKDAPAAALPTQIRAAARGEAVLDPGKARLLCGHLASLARRLSTRSVVSQALTPREHEVLARVAQGASNKQIARDLCIALPTVKNHIHHVFEKLEFRSRWDAVAYMQRDVRRLRG